MAVQFHALPVHLFPVGLRAAVARLNHELRDLFALEGTVKEESLVKRSDATVARKTGTQVHITRITPDLSGIISSDGAFLRETTLGTAPSYVTFKVLSGPPDQLYASMQATGGSWVWVPIIFAP